jgi:hypothetical protein
MFRKNNINNNSIQFNSSLCTQYFLLICVLTQHPINNNNNNNNTLLCPLWSQTRFQIRCISFGVLF